MSSEARRDALSVITGRAWLSEPLPPLAWVATMVKLGVYKIRVGGEPLTEGPCEWQSLLVGGVALQGSDTLSAAWHLGMRYISFSLQ